MRGASLAVWILLFAGAAVGGERETFVGFRLLDLENQSVKWHSPRLREGAAVTYAFATGATNTPGARNCARMLPPDRAYAPSGIDRDTFRREVAAAFRMWEEAADIAFRQVADPAAAGIVIGAQAEPKGRAFTNVALKPAGKAGRKVIARSLICLNPRMGWKTGYDGDLDVYDLRHTLAHEIGHAIGLDHPSPSGQLMSYRYDERRQGLQAGDIAGAALLYGARSEARRFTGGIVTGSNRRTADKDRTGPPFGIGEDATTAEPSR